jgi:glucose/arabinose dehydrogenase
METSMMRCLFAVVLLALASAAVAAPYRVETVATGLQYPWSIAFLPDGSQLVTERAGRLRRIVDGALLATPVAGVPEVFASGQAGLFEVALDPEFARTQYVYLTYAHGRTDANSLRVLRARFDGAALHEAVVLFTAQPAKRGNAHYGGRLAFLGDGTLVLGIGDAFILREAAQRLDTHLGKFVRLTRDGAAPPDNPFVGRDGALPEIYSLGHRNPQGVAVDPEQAVLYAHEHGPRGGDEVNRITAGGNYGWPLATFGVDYTGAHVSPWSEYPGTVAPLLHWTPSVAPAGMAVYRGDLFPAWRGSLLVSTLVEKSVRRIPILDGRAGEQEILFAELGERLRDVRAAPDGSLWLLTDAQDGRVLRVVPASPPSAAQ